MKRSDIDKMLSRGWQVGTLHEHFQALRESDQKALEIKAAGEATARTIKEQGDEKALNLAREIQSYKDAQQKSDLAAVLSEIKTAIKPLADYVASQQGGNKMSNIAWGRIIAVIAMVIALYSALRPH